jgi:hypothetical protein
MKPEGPPDTEVQPRFCIWRPFLFGMNPISFLMNGKRWKLKWQRAIQDKGVQCYGICHHDDRIVAVLKSLKGQPELETYVHELGHAAGLYHEPFVESACRDVTAVLWKLGYRRLTPEQIETLGID